MDRILSTLKEISEYQTSKGNLVIINDFTAGTLDLSSLSNLTLDSIVYSTDIVVLNKDLYLGSLPYAIKLYNTYSGSVINLILNYRIPFVQLSVFPEGIIRTCHNSKLSYKVSENFMEDLTLFKDISGYNLDQIFEVRYTDDGGVNSYVQSVRKKYSMDYKSTQKKLDEATIDYIQLVNKIVDMVKYPDILPHTDIDKYVQNVAELEEEVNRLNSLLQELEEPESNLFIETLVENRLKEIAEELKATDFGDDTNRLLCELKLITNRYLKV